VGIAARQAGKPGASWHSGRRMLITRLAERGIDLKKRSPRAPAKTESAVVYVEANPRRLARILQDVTW
jgi:hypothetical protein